MSASVEGDFAKLRRLIDGMGKLNSPSFRRETTALLGEEVLARVQLGFVDGRDPYGNAWAPVKRGGQPLRLTGRLMNSVRRRQTSGGFAIETNVAYAGIHNYGGTVRRAGQVNAHARSGRFRKQSGIRSSSVRVSFSPAHDSSITRRQFLPDADRLPPAYRAGMERVLLAQRRRYLGR